MPTVHIDYSTVADVGITTDDTDGTHIDLDAVLVPVLVPRAQVQDWLNLYNPSSSSSPLAADSRVIARAVLDAVRKHEGVQ
jgi:hypothetical protein